MVPNCGRWPLRQRPKIFAPLVCIPLCVSWTSWLSYREDTGRQKPQPFCSLTLELTFYHRLQKGCGFCLPVSSTSLCLSFSFCPGALFLGKQAIICQTWWWGQCVKELISPANTSEDLRPADSCVIHLGSRCSPGWVWTWQQPQRAPWLLPVRDWARGTQLSCNWISAPWQKDNKHFQDVNLGVNSYASIDS